ncbi:M48 family metallopeptidase [Anaeromyxobacter terrae]|uniref:M48 family metallopeptidase n=1 Tax=Anaeromyxobacter terrae TaxID=2925406 RepID=UPI001F580A86|nr:M48 family metallopeptidase [Anaeromyxobacter sp. SG22]
MSRATLDFFAAQAAARRRTAVLALLFALAWVGTIAVVYGLATLALGLHPGLGLGLVRAGADRTRDLLGVAGIVSLVTAGGALVHGVRLASGGGASVAELLGGTRVDAGTADPAERQLLNVVEEMAIAAGVPVPTVYVLAREEGINAFAAGFAPDRAVVAVTRGAIEALTRDELQGVVAHELSHVVNSDTRLNLQLMALVGGLTWLALAGRFLVRIGFGRDDGRVRLRARRSVVGLGLLGVAVWAAGSVGAFFGLLIRLAVSRTREHLADAEAVQFTRNPDGLAGALAKIARQGSVLHSPAAPEAAHLFFADGLASRLLATHPPIEERIRRIAPHLAARLLAALPPVPPAEEERLAAAFAPSTAGVTLAPQVVRARALLAGIPPALAVAAQAPASAGALARALLVDRDDTARAGQLASVQEAALRAEVGRLGAAISGVDRAGRMALLDLAAPALTRLAPADGEALVRDLRALAAADGRTSVFEWAVQRIVARRVVPRAPRSGGRARSVEDVQVECLEVLSLLAWLGSSEGPSAQAALDAGVSALGASGPWRILPRGRVGAARLEAALTAIDAAAPRVKERVLAACEACAGADGRVIPEEGEVLRAIAASLGVPAPRVEGGEGEVRAAEA